jgi:hypothetical protein
VLDLCLELFKLQANPLGQNWVIRLQR